MPDPSDLADQQDRALARLLELGLAAAEKVQARLIATEDDALLGELSLALNRASRSVRQTIALQMKVAHERQRQDRDAAALATKADESQVRRRRAQVKAAVERLIWTEAEDDEAERLLDDLDERLDEAALYDDFIAQSADAQIARLCADLGLPIPPPLGEVSPNTTESASAQTVQPPLPDGGATTWRSSA